MFLFDVGVIGTAFRKEEQSALNKEVFGRMVNDFFTMCVEHKWLTCISGGAAGADHLAVMARTGDIIKSLTLCIPGRFDVDKCMFVNTDVNGKAVYYERDVNTANYYHQNFLARTGIDSLGMIRDLIVEEKVTMKSYSNFKERNKVVAEHCRYLVAYTFGMGEPGSSGTMHTWKMNEYAGNGVRIHRCIAELGTGGVNKISNFNAPGYEWLSNFYEVQISYGNIHFGSVENAYQACKCQDPEDMLKFVGITPGQAKRLGRKVDIIPDWDKKKLYIMEVLLRQKFRIPELRDKLKATGDVYLEEGNTWGDTYWGVCQGKGENHLGKLLMKIRSEL